MTETDNDDSSKNFSKDIKRQAIEYTTKTGSKFYCIRQLDEEGFPSEEEKWIRIGEKDKGLRDIVSGSRTYGFCLDKKNLKDYKGGKEGISVAEIYVELAKEAGYSGKKGRILFAFRRRDGKVGLSYASTVKSERLIIGNELEEIVSSYLGDTQITKSPEEPKDFSGSRIEVVEDFELKSDEDPLQIGDDQT